MAKKKYKAMMNSFLRGAVRKLGYMTYGAVRAPAAQGIEYLADKAGVGDKYRAIGVVDESLLIMAGWAGRKALGRKKVPYISDILDCPKTIEWARLGEETRVKIMNMFKGTSGASDIFGGY